MYLGIDDLCDVDSGHTTITDAAGLPQNVYASVTRDGSVWLRAGQDHASLDWVYVDEPRIHFHTVILDADDIHVLQVFTPTQLDSTRREYFIYLDKAAKDWLS